MKKFIVCIKKNYVIILLVVLILIQVFLLNKTIIKNFFNPLVWRENNSSVEVLNSMATNIIKIKTKDKKTMIVPDSMIKSGVNSTILYYYNQYILGTNSYFNHSVFLSMYNDKGYEDVNYLYQHYIKYLVMWKQEGRRGYIEIYKINRDNKELVYTFDVDITSLYNEYKSAGLEAEFYKYYNYIVKQYETYDDVTAKTYINEFERGGSVW